MQDTLTSSEVAALLGVGASTVKRWSDTGALCCIKTLGQHRRYRRSDVEAFANRNGLRLGWSGTRPDVSSGVAAHAASVSEWIELLLAPVGSAFEVQAALLTERARRGTWSLVADALGPVVAAVGERWHDGSLAIGEEHIATERLRRGLVLCAEAMPVSPTAPVALLATPAREDHCLGLALAEVCLRELGFRTRWLGPRTPTDELLLAIAREDVALVALSASSAADNREELVAELQKIGSACAAKHATLVVGGGGAWPEAMDYGVRVHDFASLPRALEAVQEGAATR